MIKFVLNGCDISLIAEAPKDITLEQLLKQCDKIHPDWCACGIYSYENLYGDLDLDTEIFIGYDSVTATEDAPCTIKEGGAE